MSAPDLIRMANQIAANFHAYPHEQAVASVAEHIRGFWDPRMRAELASLLKKSDGAGLSDLARQGAQRVCG